MKSPNNHIVIRVALLYALFGGLWIILSDRILVAVITDPRLLTNYQTYKGWIFVALSTVFIFAILRREMISLRETEEKLKKSEEKFQNFIQHSQSMFYSHTADHILTYVSPQSREILDCEPEEAMVRWQEFLSDHPLNRRGIDFTETAIRTGERQPTYELELVTRNGRKIWVRVDESPVVRNGATIGIVGSITDITRHKHAQDELRKTEERLRLAVQAANIGLWERDLRSNQVYFSPEWKRQIGYDVDEISNDLSEWENRVHPDDIEQVRDKLDRYLDDPWPNYSNEFRFRHKDGSYLWIMSQASVTRDSKGKPIIMRGSHIDITERKRFEKSLEEHTRQLETLNNVMTSLSTSLELDEVLKMILDQMQSIMPRDSAAIFLIEPRGARVVMDSCIRPSVIGKVFPNDNFLFADLADSREPLVVDDPRSDERFGNWGADENIKTWMGVPLLAHGELIGYMTLDSNRTNAYTPNHVSILTSFAAQAAQAIVNARQFSYAEKLVDRISSLRQIDQAITNSLDLRVTMGVLLTQVINQLGVDAAAVLIYQPKSQSLELISSLGFANQMNLASQFQLGRGVSSSVIRKRRIVEVHNANRITTELLGSSDSQTNRYVSYIGIPLLAKGEVKGVLEIYHRQSLKPDSDWLDFLNTLAGQAAIAIDNITLYDHLQRSNYELIHAYDATIEGWARALEMRDVVTEGHSRRVVQMTLQLARRLGLKDDSLIHIRRGALLHDIGKMGIPDSILHKPDKLNEHEWQVMRQHPVHAYEWLSEIPYLRQALEIPYCHHEKWDGSGYPRGLKGEEIPLAARIFTLVDVYDALGSNRPYRRAWHHRKIIDHIQEQSGKHFDPNLVNEFMKMIENQS